MSYTITPADEGDHIVIEVHGVINRQVGMQMIFESHALGRELGVNKYLLDATDAINDDSTIDQYHFANTDLATADGVDRLAKVAALVAPDDHSHDFIETVCRNVGLNLRLFRKREDAMAFLGHGDTVRPQQRLSD